MKESYMDEEEKHLEILCDHCKGKANDAIHHDQYWFEGLWWDMHWTGREQYEEHTRLQG